MPGNKTVFQDAVKKGHNAAWDQEWSRAIAEYRRAAVEFPEDAMVHLSLAHALEEAGQLEESLHECRIASKLQPHDPQVLLRVARLQEKLNQFGQAAGTYLAVAEMFVQNKSVGKAVEAWQKAAALEPDRTDVHQRLADIYEQGARHSLAAKEYVTLGRILLKRGDKSKALSAAQRALKLDSSNPGARSLCDQLESRTAGSNTVPSPVDRAQKQALSRLAETLLEERPTAARGDVPETASSPEGSPTLPQAEIEALIARAVDAQSQHRIADAIESYRKLTAAGVARPEVKFNLGLLYLESMRYEDAIKVLGDTVADPNYALASHFALGQCYRAQGKVDAAVDHFLQVTKIVDLSSVRREQADELISVYEGLAESYAAKGDREQAESFSRALQEFLTSKGWEDKVSQVRRHLELLREEGGQVSLAEVIEIPESDKVLESLALAQDYMRRGKYYAATEECYRSIEFAPTYLPAHVRLAELYAKQDRLPEARAKYQVLGELATARGDLGRAEGFYRHALDIASDDVGDRSRLIDILIQQGRPEATIEQYLGLGDSYVRAGKYAQAAEKFAEGLRLATHAGTTNALTPRLRHRYAEARARQGDLKSALAAYQEIRQQSPEDERALVHIIDLQFRLGQSAAAQKDLEALLDRYQARSEPQKALAVLEGLAKSHPKETAPRACLAQTYMLVGDRAQAVAALDALGEIQLSAGQKQAAATTIRQIIAMNPPRVEEYKELLQQIVK